MEVVASVLRRMQVRCDLDDARLRVEPSTPVGGARIVTGLWPGLPSDLISLVTVLATQAAGRTLLHDWMYELRLFALEQLSGMGADLFLCDPHRIIVTGPRRLRGRTLDTRDLRSGMALAAAALAADGAEPARPARDDRARLRQPHGPPDVPRRAGGADRRSGARPRPATAVAEPGARRHRVPLLDVGFGGSRGGVSDGSSEIRPPLSRPTRNGRRSTSDRSRTRMMCGVSVTMMSVSLRSVLVRPNSRPMIGSCAIPASPSSVVRSSSRIRPAMMLVSPSFSRITDDDRSGCRTSEGPRSRFPRCCSLRPSAAATPRRRGGCAA